MPQVEIAHAGPLHDSHPETYAAPPTLEEIAAVVPGNVLAVYFITAPDVYTLGMMEVVPRAQWPDGLIRCLSCSNLTALGIPLDSTFSLLPEFISEIHADIVASAITLPDKPGGPRRFDGAKPVWLEVAEDLNRKQR